MNTKKIMILENNIKDQKLIKQQLLQYFSNCVFITAKDEVSFLQKIEWFLPDIIISELRLDHEYSGLEALSIVRLKELFIPFIFISNFLEAKNECLSQCSKLADGVISKNSIEELPSQLRKILRKHESKILKSRISFESQLNQEMQLEKEMYQRLGQR